MGIEAMLSAHAGPSRPARLNGLPIPELRNPPARSRKPAADRLDKAETPQIGHPASDRAADVVGAHGAVQDSSRAAVKAAGGLKQTNMTVAAVAKVAEGDKFAVDGLASALARGIGHTQVGWAARPIAKFSAGTLRLLGKGAMALGIASAVYDTSKAVTERDPAQKNKAWATAGLTVAGTVAGTAGVLIGLGPVGVGLLGASAAIGVFQLVDTLAFKERGTKWLGDQVVAPVRQVFS